MSKPDEHPQSREMIEHDKREREKGETREVHSSICEKWLRAGLEEPTRNLIRVRTYR